MDALSESWNETISLNHLNIILPLISLMSIHFSVNSFTLISDKESESALTLLKFASNFYLKINYIKIEDGGINLDENYKHVYDEGYIVMGKFDTVFPEVISKNPKLIVAVYTFEKNDPTIPNFFFDIVITPPISFFVVPVPGNYSSQNNSQIQCFRLYKPSLSYPLKVLPTTSYGGRKKPQWSWDNENIYWHSFEKEVRNMEGVTINIGLISHLEENKTLLNFWSGRDSFFWKALQTRLRYRHVLSFNQFSYEDFKYLMDIYKRLIKQYDGLAALPVITRERCDFTRFVLTGIDQKYHLLVRTPQYVHSWHSIFKPLAHNSWLYLVFVILLISLALKIVTFREKSLRTDLSSCFLTVFGFVCSQSCPSLPTNASGCMVCYTALLFSMLIYQFYTSNFYSLLSTKEVSLPFSSLEEFLVKRTHKLYIHPDTAIYGNILTAKEGILKQLQEVLKRDPDHKMALERLDEIYGNVCKGTAAVLSFPYQVTHSPNLKCTVLPVNSGYFPANTVTTLRKDFPFMSQFAFVHMRLQEAGLTRKFAEKYFRIRQQHRTQVDVINEPISMIHIAILFAFHFAATILSWIILIIEVMVSKAKNKNKS